MNDKIDQLSDVIVEILKENSPLSIPQIEHHLKLRGDWHSDTFDVRDVVHNLIYFKKAEHVHPGRFVKLVD